MANTVKIAIIYCVVDCAGEACAPRSRYRDISNDLTNCRAQLLLILIVTCLRKKQPLCNRRITLRTVASLALVVSIAFGTVETPMYIWLLKIIVVDFFPIAFAAYLVQTYAILIVSEQSAP